ncbi:glycoside hydrolase superfamily [Obelidium mucronatum]|nr:glycoside hydrolase superfamily [Obelidium mucronatum]
MLLNFVLASMSAALAAAAPCAAPWVSSAVYRGGAQVSYNGVNYNAKWYADFTNTPGKGDPWAPLGACGGGTTTVAPTTTTTTTTTTRVSTAGTTVQTTVAPSTTTTTTTTTSAVATTTGTSTLPYCYDAYIPGLIYNPTDPAADKKASLNGNNYVAKYYTSGTPSPTASDWTFEGPCVPAPPPPPSKDQCYPKWISGKTYSKDTIVSENGVNYQAKYESGSQPSKRTEWVKLNNCDIKTLNPRPYSGTPGIIGYWAQWAPYTRPQTRIDLLDLTNFSVINYAFLNALSDGSLKSFDDWADFLHITRLTGTARVKYPNLRTVISVGGWSGSVHFSNIAKSATATANFVKNIKKYLSDNGFDGLDLDWEYPSGGGLSCNAALRAELGNDIILSIATSPDVNRYVVNGVNYLPAIAEQLSYIQVMTYDFYGSCNQPRTERSGQSPDPSKDYVDIGIPKSKLVPGVGFYGRSWNVANNTNNGLYQHCTSGGYDANDLSKPCNNPVIQGDVLDDPWQSPCTGSAPDAQKSRSTVWMYHNLRGDTAGVRQQVGAPLANGALTGSNGWTPNLHFLRRSRNPIEAKTAWAKSNGFPGIMAWEIDQDYKN